jgi:hypothetical protein
MPVPFSAHIAFRHQASEHNSLAISAFRAFIGCNLCLTLHELSPSEKAEQVGMAIEFNKCFNQPNMAPGSIF